MSGSGYWNVSDIDKLTVKGDFNGCMKTARGLSHCHEVCVQNCRSAPSIAGGWVRRHGADIHLGFRPH